VQVILLADGPAQSASTTIESAEKPLFHPESCNRFLCISKHSSLNPSPAAKKRKKKKEKRKKKKEKRKKKKEKRKKKKEKRKKRKEMSHKLALNGRPGTGGTAKKKKKKKKKKILLILPHVFMFMFMLILLDMFVLSLPCMFKSM
jgi:Flp pilus assembly protein TadB